MAATEQAVFGTTPVVQICRDLIRINTSNPTHVEGPAADYVAEILRECGIDFERFEPAPGRASLVARLPGAQPELAPMLIHTHLDTVPAGDGGWSHDPFGGDIADGYVWGRGAVDMKGMVAAVLAVVQQYHLTGSRPRRDVVLAFFADEEAGGRMGAAHVAQTRPDLFSGCEVAIGEVGGFSIPIAGKRAYLVSSGEKGFFWTRLEAEGTAGHASMINDDNPIHAVAGAVHRIAGHRFEPVVTRTGQLLLEQLGHLLGLQTDGHEVLLDKLGPVSRMLRAMFRNTLNPTILEGGYKSNVIPGTASVTVDGRFLPGEQDRMEQALQAIAGNDVSVRPILHGDALEAPWGTPLVAAIRDAIAEADESGIVVPYISTAFTDAKWLARLDIDCYGFCPMLLPDELDFTALFHGVDERVPSDSLDFCVTVLTSLLNRF